MRYFVSILALMVFVCNANAVERGRPTMSGKMIMSAPRGTASVNQLKTVSGKTTTETEAKEEKDMREAERNACINNNIGIGNTFVWASRFSNTDNYASMVEDLEKPENNVCFVRVELKSDDESRIKVSDVAPKYFMWGEAIECGSWADEKEMEKRILDARKGARIGGIVASTVGGAGLGVGAMELFGNAAIGGKLEGQRSLSEEQLLKSNLLALKNSDKYTDQEKYNEIRKSLLAIKAARQANQISDKDYAKYEDLINLVD